MVLQRHPWGFNYLRLLFLATLIRIFVFPKTWLSKRRQIMVEGPVYKRIAIPSRDKGRAIIADLYLPPRYDNSKSAPVMINMHGYVYAISI